MNYSEKLISLLGAIFSTAARLRFLSVQRTDDGNVHASPGLFYRGGMPATPGFSLDFARAQRRQDVAVFVVANARTDAQTEAITDVSVALIR